MLYYIWGTQKKVLGHGHYRGGGGLCWGGGGGGGWVGVGGLISTILLNRSSFRAILKVVGLS